MKQIFPSSIRRRQERQEMRPERTRRQERQDMRQNLPSRTRRRQERQDMRQSLPSRTRRRQERQDMRQIFFFDHLVLSPFPPPPRKFCFSQSVAASVGRAILCY